MTVVRPSRNWLYKHYINNSNQPKNNVFKSIQQLWFHLKSIWMSWYYTKTKIGKEHWNVFRYLMMLDFENIAIYSLPEKNLSAKVVKNIVDTANHLFRNV